MNSSRIGSEVLKKIRYRRVIREKLRTLLAIFSMMTLFGILTYVLYIINVSGPKTAFLSRSFNEATKAAIDIKLTQSSDFFQIGLVLIGGVWGLIIARKDEAALVFKDFPEIIMSISSTLLLSLSLIFHVIYTGTLTDIYSDAGIIISRMETSNKKKLEEAQKKNDSIGIAKYSEKPSAKIPDVFQENINYQLVAQSLFLFCGLIVALLTFVSAHKLKEQ